MNICFVSREFLGSKRAGGIATYVGDVAKALVSKGHNVFVITASDNIFKSEQKVIQNITIIKLSGADFFLHSNKYIQFIGCEIANFFNYNSYRKKISKTILKLNNDFKLDIVEFPEYGNEAKFWNTVKNLVPTVVRFHGPNGHDRSKNTIDTKKSNVKSLFNTAFKSDGITFCSDAIRTLIQKTEYSNNLFKSYKNKHAVIFNPIRLEERYFDEIINSKFIFIAGSFSVTKGFKELIEAVKLINLNGYKINLIAAGKLGELGDHYKKLSITDSGYNKWLKILGPINRSDLFTYYKNAMICVFPSHFEPFGLTCIEAMSVGGLVLGSSNGGMSEIINEGEDGFLVAPKNKELLRDKILEILSINENEKDLIRTSAKNKIEGKFSEKQIIDQMITFYKEVINNKKC